ncbi:AGAP008168-PA, partial [Anopheles gambiae str. PEST]
LAASSPLPPVVPCVSLTLAPPATIPSPATRAPTSSDTDGPENPYPSAAAPAPAVSCGALPPSSGWLAVRSASHRSAESHPSVRFVSVSLVSSLGMAKKWGFFLHKHRLQPFKPQRRTKGVR